MGGELLWTDDSTKNREHQKASCAISMSMASPCPTYRSLKKNTAGAALGSKKVNERNFLDS
ncbi:unnamed protein product [Ectocarpus sp. 12 AP-2014]